MEPFTVFFYFWRGTVKESQLLKVAESYTRLYGGGGGGEGLHTL